jgi:protein-disulfide isomerase
MSVSHTTSTRRERRSAKRAMRRVPSRPRRSAGSRLDLGRLSILGIIGGLAVVALAIAFGVRPSPPPAEGSVVAAASVPPDLTAEGFVLGRNDAPVTIDLYEDFQCPACKAWGRNVFPSLAANELAAGTVNLVFHDMSFLGPESVAAGRAGYAASLQRQFWDLWATLYANQGRENSGAYSRDRLIAMADQLGLDTPRFVADMDSSAALTYVEAAAIDAGRSGVTATPTVLIDGRAVSGAQAYATLSAAISAAAVR